jgi:hypothetical protein
MSKRLLNISGFCVGIVCAAIVVAGKQSNGKSRLNALPD